MKEKVNQLFKDKLTLVMLVLGLLTIVAAAGVVTLQRGQTEESPYLNMEREPEHLVDGAGNSDAGKENGDLLEAQAQTEEPAGGAGENQEDRLAEAEEDVFEAKEYAAGGQSGQDSDGLQADGSFGEAEAAPAGAGMDAAKGLVLNFAQVQSMAWPVEGNVLLDYSMDSTIYFPTLEQYKCNPGLVIQSDVSQPVSVPANARVLESGTNEEIGNYLVLDLGDGYSLTCGQLKEVQAVEGEYLERGQILGYVAEPTKYYTLEGPNVFLEVAKDGKAVDPLDYLE